MNSLSGVSALDYGMLIFHVRLFKFSFIVQALYWINLELIATKRFSTDFTSTGPLEHHIKNVVDFDTVFI